LSVKKVFALILISSVLAAVAVPTFGQRRSRRSCDTTTSAQTYSTDSPYSTRQRARADYDSAPARTSYDNSTVYYDYGYQDRSFWDKHRDKLTLAIGAGAGAAVGALIGGKRGAIIGAASGLGGSAVYTYKIRNRGYRY
jgi:YMGG-like Gly-zipper